MPKRTQKELPLQHAIVDYLRIVKVFAWITNQPLMDGSTGRFKMYHRSSTGVADILGIFKGRPLAIEVKYGKGKTTPSQDSFLDRFRKEGGIAFVAYSIDDVIKELR